MRRRLFRVGVTLLAGAAGLVLSLLPIKGLARLWPGRILTLPIAVLFGPWYGGTYNAGILSFEKRLSKRFTLGGSYSYISENDDALSSNLSTDSLGGSNGFPTDSFRGIVPVVTDPGSGTCPSKTNATASFFACNGNFVPKAGIFYNGATLDDGPSDFALRHTFEVHGLVELPWKIQFSSLFRAQSGFHYSASFAGDVVSPDVDGDNLFNGVDFYSRCGDPPTVGGCRNHFIAPRFINLDTRVARSFKLGDRVKMHAYLEFFNLFNRNNPAAVNGLPPASGDAKAPKFAQILQVLPGREGQVGIRIEF